MVHIDPNHTAPVTQKMLKKQNAANLNPLSSPLEILPKIIHDIKDITEIIRNIDWKFMYFSPLINETEKSKNCSNC